MKALVTGGGGFLGSKIATTLHARGDDVRAVGRNRYPRLERQGIPTGIVDVRNLSAVSDACQGQDIVFHTAALTGIWGKRRVFEEINTKGTAHVIQACRACGVAKLVYTSSPSVVFGFEPLAGVDETCDYPTTYLSEYARTKAAAEKMVLAANSKELTTVALRPHLIWGPNDPHLIPRVIERARAGKLVQVGDGNNLVDITYIDNAARAHLLAADALEAGAPCAGKAYFISQGEPVRFWPWLNEVLEGVGAPTVTRAITFKTAMRIGSVLEGVYGLLRLGGEPRMTRFLASVLALDHYFDLTAARRDLRYEPVVSTEEGQRRLIESLVGPKDS